MLNQLIHLKNINFKKTKFNKDQIIYKYKSNIYNNITNDSFFNFEKDFITINYNIDDNVDKFLNNTKKYLNDIIKKYDINILLNINSLENDENIINIFQKIINIHIDMITSLLTLTNNENIREDLFLYIDNCILEKLNLDYKKIDDIYYNK